MPVGLNGRYFAVEHTLSASALRNSGLNSRRPPRLVRLAPFQCKAHLARFLRIGWLSFLVCSAIIQAFTDYAVLVFPEQQLTPAQQVAFAEWFGPIEANVLAYDPTAVLRVTPKRVDISAEQRHLGSRRSPAWAQPG